MQGDITAQGVDAIVTIVPQSLEYRGGLNGAIREAAGTELDQFISREIYAPRSGDVYVLPGFDLPARHILFAVVPVWKNDFDRQDRELLNAARKCMEQARALSLATVAFPAIGTGSKGFAKPKGARLILQGIADRIDEHFQEVRIVCQTVKTKRVFEDRLDMMRFNFD